MSILGLDIGTSGTKALAFDYKGDVLKASYLEYNTIFIKEGWVELDPDIIMDAAIKVIRDVAARVSGTDPIEAMGISCLGSVVIPVDKNNEYLYNGMSFMDTRTVSGIDGIIGMERFEFYKLTGLHLNPYLTLNKILWLRENKSGIYKDVKKFYSLKEILLLKLGIDPKTDPCMASLTMFYDINKKCWSSEIFENTGIDINTFPKVTESWEIIGEIKGKYLKKLGLKNKVKVITGGADTGSCPLGAGAILPGVVSNTIGTFEEAIVGLDKIQLTEDMMKKGISCHISLIPGIYIYTGMPTTGGFVLKWFKNLFCRFEEKEAKRTGEDPYKIILKEIEKIRTNILFMPHLNGSGTPDMDLDSRGAFLNIPAGSTKKEFIKALIEGLNFEIKSMIDYYEEEICPVDSIYVTGGAVKSDQWMQVKTDILGKNIISSEVSEAGSLGVALLAAYADGIFESIEAAIKKMVRIKKVYLSNNENKDYYEQKYNKYKKAISILKEI